MQPFGYPQHQAPVQFINPSSSKALTKLRNDKLIPVNQVNYQPGQPVISYPPQNIKPLISYNAGDSSSRNSQSLNKNQSMVLRRNQSNNSGVGVFSQSQTSQLTISQNSNAYTHQSPTQQIPTLQYQPSQPVFSMNNPNINEKVSQSYQKPLSAMNRTSTNGETRNRSNSANNSLNQNLIFNRGESDMRIQNLEGKLNDYSQQIIQVSTKLSQKQSKITELQKQLSFLRNRSSDLQIRVQQSGQKIPYLQKRAKQLQLQNEKIKSAKLEIEEQNQKNMQKIMTLQSNLDKILQIKNHQIQSLNQSCAQLSKNYEQLHQKYRVQINKLTQTNKVHELNLRQNKTYFQSIAEKIKLLQTNSQNRQKEENDYNTKINDQLLHIQSLQSQNYKLKFQLDTSLNQLQLIKANYLKERDDSINVQQLLSKAAIDYENAKKIGQQQIQFLQSKVEEALLEKERLLEQIQLTKAIELKKNMVFQRKIIYDLKTENDRLWAKLIDKEQNNVNLAQNDPTYWSTTKSKPSHSRRASHLGQIQGPSSSQIHYSNIINKEKQKNSYYELQQQYRKFIEHLQHEQQKAQQVIHNMNEKQIQNNIQDIQFYKKKCINLEQMVEEHLRINISLKEQLQKTQIKTEVVRPADAQVIFLKSQLQKQQLINKTLERTFDMFKSQYELKFKSAQARVDQIENQQDKSYINADQLRKKLSQAQFQTLKLQNQNYAIKNKLQQSPSQETKYQNLYYQLKSKLEQNSPISHFTIKHQSDYESKNRKEMELLKKQYEKKQQQYQTLSMVHQQNCQAYEQQLKMKENQIDVLKREMDKIFLEFESAKIRYGPMLSDIDRLQRQLALYKKGTTFSDRKMASYFTTLIRSKLLEIDAFLKQIIEINRESRKSKDNSLPQSIKLIENGQKIIEHCLAVCSQLEANIRQ